MGFWSGVGAGFVGAAKSTAAGLKDLAKAGYALATSAEAREQAWEATKSAARAGADYAGEVYDDPVKIIRDSRDAALSAYTKAEQFVTTADAEDWGKLVGGGGFAVASYLVPAGALAKVGKLGKLAKAGKAAGKVSQGGNKVEKATEKAKIAAVTAKKKLKNDRAKCEELCEKKKVASAIETRFNALKEQGHGPQRHEGDVSIRQLIERCMNGKDPMTGTTTDGVTGAIHKYSRHATKVNTPSDYVHAEQFLKNSSEFRSKIRQVEESGEGVVVLKETSLHDIYGNTYLSKVTGQTRLGSKSAPTGTEPTDFTNGTMKAVYKRNDDGDWDLVTMYPEPH